MNQPSGAKLGRAGTPDQPSGFSDSTTDGTDPNGGGTDAGVFPTPRSEDRKWRLRA